MILQEEGTVIAARTDQPSKANDVMVGLAHDLCGCLAAATPAGRICYVSLGTEGAKLGNVVRINLQLLD